MALFDPDPDTDSDHDWLANLHAYADCGSRRSHKSAIHLEPRTEKPVLPVSIGVGVGIRIDRILRDLLKILTT